MPSRSPSRSPEVRHRKKKNKHKSRSRSPISHSKPKSSHRNPDDHRSRSHKHKKHKSSKHDTSPSRYDEDFPKKVKREKHDKGYDKYATTVSRWDSDEERNQRRPIKREPSESMRDRNNRDRSEERNHRRQRGDQRERERHDQQRRENRRNRGGGNPFRGDREETFEYGRPEEEQNEEPIEKEKPNFEVSGKLTEDTNTYKGVVIKYNEPPEARKPKRRWRLYPFKGDESMKVMHIHRQSAYLLGRDRRVADIPIDHPSCSKQHAVLQFRMVPFTREDGTDGHRIKPYIIDLGSANGSFVNNKQVEGQRYVELFEKDVLKFGFSSREYVVLTDSADTSEMGDDESEEDE